MEDVLAVYSRPYNEEYPVVCMDEKPVQFFADFRKGFRSKKNGIEYEDYQYIRNGTACIFLFTEPLASWRYADAQEHRTRGLGETNRLAVNRTISKSKKSCFGNGQS